MRDHRDRVRRVVGFSDREATKELGRGIEDLIAHKSAGGHIPPRLARWIEELPTKLQRRLVGIGLVEASVLVRSRPLEELVSEFGAALRARNRSAKHIRMTMQEALRVANGIDARFLSDIRPAAVERYLAKLRTIGEPKRVKESKHEEERGESRERGEDEAPPMVTLSARSSNRLLASIRAFCRWAGDSGLLPEDPLRSLRPVNLTTDRRILRRSLMPEEVRRLVEAALAAPPWRGMSGRDRASLWIMATTTGLRMGELRALEVGDVDLDAGTVRARASCAKNRKDATLPLHPDAVRALAHLVERKHPHARVFSEIPARTAQMLRLDLAAAKIPATDESGRVVDAHALRATFVTNLMRSGAHPATTQRLARHASATTTLGIYAVGSRDEEMRAVAAIPSVEEPESDEAEIATGTDGFRCTPNHSADSPASQAGVDETSRDVPGHWPPFSTPRRGMVVAVEGFEPPTRGL